MFLSRASQARSLRVGLTENKEEEKKKPKLEDFLSARDYTGAITLLNFQLQTGESEEKLLPWLGYCTFHLGDFKKALEIYNRLLKSPTADPVNNLYAACCMFYLGMLNEAVEAANKGPKTRLYYRIMCHVAWKRNDEPTLLAMHERLEDSVADQLCMAAIFYLRGNFQDAIDIYKRLLQQDKSRIALQVLIALCYYKLEYFEVSLELLPPYLEMYADSAIAVNLKACNTFKLFDGKAAEGELKGLMDIVQSSSHNFENDLVRHNLVVFRNGENALQVLPPLVDIIPEARLNLAVYHLRRGEVKEAHELMEALKPVTPPDYILKGVVNAALGQQIDSADHIKAAMTFYQLVGASASEMDTIPGRLCMASCFFLMKQFDDVLIYLNSVKAYCVNDPVFNYNYGIALAMCRQYREAEEALLNVQSEKFRSEYMYLSWLARCYIMNGKASEAWNLYLKLDNSDSFSFLILIANDCYRVGAFYYAAKAFDVLERLDPSPEYWEGKRGACCGVFQMVLAGKARREQLRDIIAMLRGPNTNPQSDLLARVMAKWAADNHFAV